MSVATVIHMKMNRYIRIFRTAGAIDPSHAINPVEHGVRKSLIFIRLVRQGIIISVNDDLYYLDEEKESAHRRRKQMIVAIVLLLITVGIIAGYFYL